MHLFVKRLNLLKNKVKEIIVIKQLKTQPEIIAVSKTFSLSKILPLIEYGHIHFGENKMQEAEEKWTDIKNKNNKLKLHMLGKLQSNKAKKAVKLFDYIHSLDNAKLANKINQYQKELSKKVKIFIQVNLAQESQKSGILLNDLDKFYFYCIKELSLNIIGLMTLPPVNEDPNKYFEIIKKKCDELDLPELSIGMSSDYEIAVNNDSTFLRLGTAIFGERKT